MGRAEVSSPGCRISAEDYPLGVILASFTGSCLTMAVEVQVSEPQPAFLLPHSLWSLDLHLHFQRESLELSEHISRRLSGDTVTQL